MRGYLRSPGHMYYLDTDVTSVGRGSGLKPPDQLKNVGAHIPLGSGKVEHFHAVVEKRAQENCFILVDMNTAYGTYVNEHRIQNGAVRLAPGDVVRFGHGGIPHEFNLVMEDKDEDGKNSSRTSSASESAHSPSSPLPFNINLSLKMAGPGRSSQEEKQEAWRSSENKSVQKVKIKCNNIHSRYVSMLREKEQRLLHMGDEIMRLSVLEGECKRKDGVISELRGKLNHSEQSLMKDRKLVEMGDEISRLAVYERECERKDRLVATLRDQVAKLEVNAREHLDQIRTEHDLPVPATEKLEDTRKELNLSSGLVQSLQRNGHSREQKIKKVTAQLEKSKQDYHEAKEQIHALSNKI
uniref:FHA domain-containing protein n=1 Tax=Ciona intestinalis TaxID=7719 RepID=H2Y001_CIOIN